MMRTTERYFNRELSWVHFNRRVLEEASDVSHPLLERMKFLAIFATNLDEFFMIRVAGVKELIREGTSMGDAPDGLNPQETLDEVYRELRTLINEHMRAWRDDIRPALRQNGVHVLNFDELTPEQRDFANQYFYRTLYPTLTPLAFDPGHAFPHISNLSLSLAVVIRDENGRQRFARVKVPPSLPRLLPLNECPPDDTTTPLCYVWVDQLIQANIGALFSEMTIEGVYEFRITRDADIEIAEDEADDLRTRVSRSVQERRFADVVRLEIDHEMPAFVRDILISNFKLKDRDVWHIDGPMDLSKLWELYRLELPHLKDIAFTPRVPPALNGSSNIFDQIRAGDILLHHPYESFTPVVDFIRAAARDPNVLAIKQTLYRVGPNSPIVQALMEAVENGKQVAVMVELKARFDEENNLVWTKRLEEVGAHVVTGIPRLKVHSKVALVVRKEADGIRRYVHLSTGNYNASTARIYTDMGMFTCNEEIGQDATDLFNYLTGYSRKRDYRALLVAPVNLRDSLVSMIEREIEHQIQHGDGRLVFKMNALVDTQMIDLLYRASQTGVRIDLLVRGMCSLRPGVPNISENIRVTSIVGRFLEHTRVYWFHNHGDPQTWLGSADLMERNLDRRVEVVFPVRDRALARRIEVEVLDLGINDNVKARELQPDGRYVRRAASNGLRVSSQSKLLGESLEL
jgi:polyphosphate kinase